MATVDQWTAAQSASPTPFQQPGNNGLQNAQGAWAKQYANSINAGNSDPQELNRYLNYQALLPQLNDVNKTYGTGATLQDAQKDMMNKYAQQIQNGTNNLSQYNDYLGYVKAFGGTAVKPSDQVMQQLSVGALNGDRGAQNYLQTMGLTPLQGKDLWNGFDASQLTPDMKAYNQYYSDNPDSNLARQHDINYYNTFSDKIRNGQQISQQENDWYHSIANKWNLSDLTDPYNRTIDQLKTDKTNALNAQDTALNQSLSAADANNFQTMLNTQRTINNRGIGDSGLAADAYARATMAANQDYQKAFADAATQKSDLATKYDTSIGGLQTDQLKNQQTQQQQAIANMQAQQKMQSDQDQFLTTQTGYVYVGGQPVKDGNGQPITTLDWQKMSETTRHDIAQENLDQQKNNDTYNLGVMTNATNQMKVNNEYNLGIMQNNTANAKIQADLNMKSQQLQLDWANYGLNSQKTQASIDNMIASAKTAAQNADTGAFKAQANSVASELSTLKSQMNAYVSKGQAIPATLQTQFNNTLGQYQNLIGSLGN